VVWYSVGAITGDCSAACVHMPTRNNFAPSKQVLTTLVYRYATLTRFCIVFSYTGGSVLSANENKNSDI
jgi:hypothetical protein